MEKEGKKQTEDQKKDNWAEMSDDAEEEEEPEETNDK